MMTPRFFKRPLAALSRFFAVSTLISAPLLSSATATVGSPAVRRRGIRRDTSIPLPRHSRLAPHGKMRLFRGYHPQTEPSL